MDDSATVNAADIARLAGVRRAAVSNWRRRHGDFPRPVGGTASSPLFSLPEVQEWLSSRGRPVELAPVDRAWQRLRALGDDLELGERLAAAGEYLERLAAAGGGRGPGGNGGRSAAGDVRVDDGVTSGRYGADGDNAGGTAEGGDRGSAGGGAGGADAVGSRGRSGGAAGGVDLARGTAGAGRGVGGGVDLSDGTAGDGRGGDGRTAGDERLAGGTAGAGRGVGGRAAGGVDPSDGTAGDGRGGDGRTAGDERLAGGTVAPGPGSGGNAAGGAVVSSGPGVANRGDDFGDAGDGHRPVAGAAAVFVRAAAALAADAELRAFLAEAAEDDGAATVFEQLCERFFEAHSRRVSPTAPAHARLMVSLTGAKGTTVLDPACGFGSLLLASGAARAQGEDRDLTTARIAALRLRLGGADTEVHAGDSLREDAFAGQQADVVLCDPPFNARAWGHEELVGDARWEYGLPPRGESELAWVQHCLAHAKPGGTVAILMPGAAAGRRSGKRIRANLLRAGALRAVFTLAPGADLWLLTRPGPGARPPATVLLAESTVDAAEELWREHVETGAGERIIDLLDDDVDLTPAQRRTAREDPGQAFLAAQRLFGSVGLDLPPLEPTGEEPAHTTVGELVKAGALEIHHAPARTAEGDEPVLTPDDVLAGGPPTGRAAPDDAAVIAEAGDVIASVTGAVAVHSGPPVRLGSALSLYRVDPARLDAEFLAGCLRAADFPVHSASTRIDARRLKVPRYPLAEQRAYGAAFAALAEFDRALRQTAEIGRDLVRLGFAALAEGRLRPGA